MRHSFALFGILIAMMAASCASTEQKTVMIEIDATKQMHAANDMLMGNNVQWVDKADNLYDVKRKKFNKPLLEQLKAIKVSLLRFPGGTQSDVYHWKDGVGPRGKRKLGKHVFTNTKQKMYFATDEFLELCDELNSQALITVNTETGTPQEAADWVRYCNIEKKAGVTYWEIGNEPYLKHGKSWRDIDKRFPEQYATKSVEIIKAMKKIDPTIKTGVSLCNQKLGRRGATPYLDWNKTVLSITKGYIDFVCVHNTYLPELTSKKEYESPACFTALMGAATTVHDSLLQTDKEIQQVIPDKKIGIALTEYNAFFAHPHLKFSEFTASLGGGLYVASLLTDFYKSNSLDFANFFSLNGNWYFGLISQSGNPRPQYYVMRIFSDFIGETVIDSNVINNPLFKSSACGRLGSVRGVETLDVLTSLSEKSLFFIAVNKSLDKPLRVKIKLKHFNPTSESEAVILQGPSIDSLNEREMTVRLEALPFALGGEETEVIIPKHSVIAVAIEGQVENER